MPDGIKNGAKLKMIPFWFGPTILMVLSLLDGQVGDLINWFMVMEYYPSIKVLR